jgi:hypothetical protein
MFHQKTLFHQKFKDCESNNSHAEFTGTYGELKWLEKNYPILMYDFDEEKIKITLFA